MQVRHVFISNLYNQQMSTDLSIEQCAIVLRYVTDAIHEHFTAMVENLQGSISQRQ